MTQVAKAIGAASFHIWWLLLQVLTGSQRNCHYIVGYGVEESVPSHLEEMRRVGAGVVHCCHQGVQWWWWLGFAVKSW